jgi:hypothetical protein
MPDLIVMFHKSIEIRELAETMPNGLAFIPSWEKAVLATSIIKYVICNRWEINLEYKKVLS